MGKIAANKKLPGSFSKGQIELMKCHTSANLDCPEETILHMLSRRFNKKVLYIKRWYNVNKNRGCQRLPITCSDQSVTKRDQCGRFAIATSISPLGFHTGIITTENGINSLNVFRLFTLRKTRESMGVSHSAYDIDDNKVCSYEYDLKRKVPSVLKSQMEEIGLTLEVLWDILYNIAHHQVRRSGDKAALTRFARNFSSSKVPSRVFVNQYRRASSHCMGKHVDHETQFVTIVLNLGESEPYCMKQGCLTLWPTMHDDAIPVLVPLRHLEYIAFNCGTIHAVFTDKNRLVERRTLNVFY